MKNIDEIGASNEIPKLPKHRRLEILNRSSHVPSSKLAGFRGLDTVEP